MGRLLDLTVNTSWCALHRIGFPCSAGSGVSKTDSLRPFDLNDLGIVHDDLDDAKTQRSNLLLDNVKPRG